MARDRLAGSEPLALGLELVVLGAFLASLGEYLFPVLLTVHGNVMIFGTLLVDVAYYCVRAARCSDGCSTPSPFGAVGSLPK